MFQTVDKTPRKVHLLNCLESFQGQFFPLRWFGLFYDRAEQNCCNPNCDASIDGLSDIIR